MKEDSNEIKVDNIGSLMYFSKAISALNDHLMKQLEETNKQKVLAIDTEHDIVNNMLVDRWEYNFRKF